MPFQRPTLKEIDDRIRNDIAGRMRIDSKARTASLFRRSVVAVLSRVYAGACHLLYAFLAWLAKQRFVFSMEDEFLDAEGLAYDIPRKAADFAGGGIVVQGADGAQVPAGTVYQSDEEVQVRVTGGPAVSGGTALLSVEAVAAGVAGNLPAGTILRPLHPVPGVQSEAVVTEGGLSDGVDVESDEYYRDRILDRKREPPHGGNKHDYEQWAKEVPGVTRAWCLPLWLGEGTVGLMFVRDNDPDPIPGDEHVAVVAAHIEAVRPVTAEVFVFAPERYEIDITAKLSPDTEETRQAVRDEAEDFIDRDGQPDGMVYVSRLSEAISAAIGEHHHNLIMPAMDIKIPANAVPVLGELVFVDNPEGV